MRRAFKLHHHKHTGKLIHHRHTSYWALCLLVIISGVFTVTIERAAHADDLLVSAIVPAPIPADAPTITAPADGTTVTSSPVELSGGCPVITPAVVIQFIEHATTVGSAPCRTDGTFAVHVALSPGAHDITAQVITITGQTGQSSAPLHLTYTPPSPVVPDATAPIATQPTSSDGHTTDVEATPVTMAGVDGLTLLGIELSQSFVSYRPGHAATLRAAFTGGSLPYSVSIAWGDGTTTTETIHDQTMHAFSHTYQQSSPYLLSVTLTDARQEVLTRNYAAVDATPAGPHSTPFTMAGLLDATSSLLIRYPLAVYGSLLGILLVLWRIELLLYPNRIGIPIHYHWQQPKGRHRGGKSV